jgi:hypothetical protein
MQTNGVHHDQSRCKCGTDPIEEAAAGPACQCKCKECRERREQVIYHWRRIALAKRLEAANIDLDLLADLIWMKIEPSIEARIEQMSKDAVNRALQGIRLLSIVESRDWP